MPWLAVFIGGGLGSLCRFGISRILLHYRYSGAFPYATIISNVLACVVLAVVTYLYFEGKNISANWRIFWLVGFCGGFSTFSTFSIENWVLFKDGHYYTLLANVLLSLLLCFFVFMIIDRKVNI